MKKILFLLIGMTFLSFRVDKDTISGEEKIPLRKLKKLLVVGDFDGDSKTDTLLQGAFSKKYQTEIDSSANPFRIEWDSVVNWFYEQETDIYLRLTNSNADTLHLGIGQGLYCLINLGDLNGDKTDEVAFVMDYCDFSQTNDCRVYTLCNGKWTKLKQFGVHEYAFSWFTDSEEAPEFNQITEYLELKKGKWVFHDYNQLDYDSPEEVGKMNPLEKEPSIRQFSCARANR